MKDRSHRALGNVGRREPDQCKGQARWKDAGPDGTRWLCSQCGHYHDELVEWVHIPAACMNVMRFADPMEARDIYTMLEKLKKDSAEIVHCPSCQGYHIEVDGVRAKGHNYKKM